MTCDLAHRPESGSHGLRFNQHFEASPSPRLHQRLMFPCHTPHKSVRADAARIRGIGWRWRDWSVFQIRSRWRRGRESFKTFLGKSLDRTGLRAKRLEISNLMSLCDFGSTSGIYSDLCCTSKWYQLVSPAARVMTANRYSDFFKA